MYSVRLINRHLDSVASFRILLTCVGFVVSLATPNRLFSREVSFGSEASSSNDRALNFRKPYFHLVELTRIGKLVMEPTAGWC